MKITGRKKDLGDNFHVRRVLPSARQRMVGPFIFFDHMGPATFAPGQRFDVRPHPHIGLATVTYLFDGEIMHRDSLGTEQAIRPGAVNWMVAGKGIVHSERTSAETEASGQRMEGIQAWVALPADHEEDEPSFDHIAADELPEITWPGAAGRLIAGDAYGERAPVRYPAPIFYVHVEAEAGAVFPLPDGHVERALYVVRGQVELLGETVDEGTMVTVGTDTPIEVRAARDAIVMLLGGAPVGKRHIWWNLVSSREDRIAAAAADWKEGRFPVVPGDDDEAIPLPEGAPQGHGR
ncbi:pirin family protein [Pacificimonas sp. WHA3]|uniref:Pirin family protein n=1 Tax=Pacificimonas pallii TaxID=2827236 RepID=A0ABS6SCT5_9SPHN|nr:pirin family protein [Pacificimonas pallii]MBV7255721.1 pirin family protein [Pacificimonas pallii]